MDSMLFWVLPEFLTKISILYKNSKHRTFSRLKTKLGVNTVEILQNISHLVYSICFSTKKQTKQTSFKSKQFFF